MNWRIPLLIVVGATLLVVGVGLMTMWEFEVFRATTFDRDFTSLVCGAPLDNPGWATGSPCHGAVNRQTGFAMIVAGLGIATIVPSVVSTPTTRRRRRSRLTRQGFCAATPELAVLRAAAGWLPTRCWR